MIRAEVDESAGQRLGNHDLRGLWVLSTNIHRCRPVVATSYAYRPAVETLNLHDEVEEKVQKE